MRRLWSMEQAYALENLSEMRFRPLHFPVRIYTPHIPPAGVGQGFEVAGFAAVDFLRGDIPAVAFEESA